MGNLANNKKLILTKPVNELEISPEFLEMCKRNGFNKLEDIVVVPVYKFVKLPYSGYRMLYELMKLLKRHQLEHLLIED